MLILLLISVISQSNFTVKKIIPDEGGINGRVVPGVIYYIPFYDANHDGYDEFYLECIDTSVTDTGIGAIAYQWNGEDYVPVWKILGWHQPLAIGDLDNDSLADMISLTAGYPNDTICVMEAVSPDSFPSQIVWVASEKFWGYYWCITDLDQDGNNEFIFKGAGIGPYIGKTALFETTGDNQYECKAVIDDSAPDFFTFGDFDKDGLFSYFSGNDPHYDGDVVENVAVGVDSYQVVAKIPKPAGYYSATGKDMDGNGWDEIVSTWEIGYPALTFYLNIFEATGNNTYRVVMRDTFPSRMDWASGRGTVDCADVDGDGKDEIILDMDETLAVYKAIAPDYYVRIWQTQSDSFAGWNAVPGLVRGDAIAFADDLNKNGYAEIVWSGYTTFILEYNSFNQDIGSLRFLHPITSVPVSPPNAKMKKMKSSIKEEMNTSLKLPYQRLYPEEDSIYAIDWHFPVLADGIKEVKGGDYTIFNKKRPKTVSPEDTVYPEVIVYNYGLDGNNFLHRLDIDSSGVIVHSDIKEDYLSSRAGRVDTFSGWHPGPHGNKYRLWSTVLSAGDENLDNNITEEDIWTVQYMLYAPYTDTPPVIDGVIDTTEWKDAYKIDISDFIGMVYDADSVGSAILYLESDTTGLYIGIDAVSDTSLDNWDQIGLYIDDNNNNDYPPVGRDAGGDLLPPEDSTEGNLWITYFDSTGTDVKYRAIVHDTTHGGAAYYAINLGEVEDIPAKIKKNKGHLQYEVKIPYAVGKYPNEWLNSVSLGDTIGLFLYGLDSLQCPCFDCYPPVVDYYSVWPEDIRYAMPLYFGKVVLGKKPEGGITENKQRHPSLKFYAKLLRNPVRDKAIIEFGLPKRENVELRVYDLTGRLVAEPINKPISAGVHRIRWNGNTSGVYFYQLKAEGKTGKGKIIIVK